MINLIPNEEKKKMRRDFYYRLMVMFLVAVAMSIFIGVIVLVPSYVLSAVKSKLALEKLELQKSEPVPVPDQVTLDAIATLDKKISIIEKIIQKPFGVADRVVSGVIVNKMPDIKIYSIAYKNDDESGRVIDIKGIAPSRNRLLAFRLALEDDDNFEKVDLPISNFVRGSNIDFSLTLIPSK